MQEMKPCARCEQELPEAFFDAPNALFCKHCAAEVNELLTKKYNVIEAAHFRAQLRLSARKLKKKLTARESVAAAGD